MIGVGIAGRLPFSRSATLMSWTFGYTCPVSGWAERDIALRSGVHPYG